MSCCATEELDLGTTVALKATLSTAGALVDGSSVVCMIKDPTGAITTPSVFHDGTGTYRVLVVGTIAGQWWFRLTAGSPVAAVEGSFVIAASHFS